VGVVTLKQVFEAASSGPTTSSLDVSATSTVTATGTSAPASRPGKVDGGVIAGAVIGTSIGLAMLLAILCVVRRRAFERAVANNTIEIGSGGTKEVEESLKAEADGMSQRHELNTSMNRAQAQELPGLPPSELSTDAAPW
jgi:hypothetical protein